MTKIFELNTLQDTTDLAEYLQPLIKCGDVICLYGDLGSGKTTFVQALGKSLGIQDDVDSPSFVMLKEYQTGLLPLFHLDLYRMKEEDELMDFGILRLQKGQIYEDIFNNVYKKAYKMSRQFNTVLSKYQ